MTREQFVKAARALGYEPVETSGYPRGWAIRDLPPRKARWFPHGGTIRHEGWMKALPTGYWRRTVDVTHYGNAADGG
jgi:hypothetical protein